MQARMLGGEVPYGYTKRRTKRRQNRQWRREVREDQRR